MVDVIAGHCVKSLIREIQVRGISLAEADIFYPFSLCIILTERLVERSVFLAPAVNADHLSFGIPLCDRDSQRSAAAANVQARAAFGQVHVFRDPIDMICLDICLVPL